MASIYPNDASRQALVVFRMTKGSGEFFDLSTSPITRASFEIGGYTPDENDLNQAEPYFITDACSDVRPTLRSARKTALNMTVFLMSLIKSIVCTAATAMQTARFMRSSNDN